MSMTKHDTMSKNTSKSKIYKVLFNNKEVLLKSNRKYHTNKNKSEMLVLANDVLDCMNKAKELYLNKYKTSAKSIEVMNTSTSFVDRFYYNDIYNSQKEVA